MHNVFFIKDNPYIFLTYNFGYDYNLTWLKHINFFINIGIFFYFDKKLG